MPSPTDVNDPFITDMPLVLGRCGGAQREHAVNGKKGAAHRGQQIIALNFSHGQILNTSDGDAVILFELAAIGTVNRDSTAKCVGPAPGNVQIIVAVPPNRR
jgi:hypothetical protein